MTDPESILSYWFSEKLDDEESVDRQMNRWFKGGPNFDDEIRGRFASDLEKGCRGEYDVWAETPRGCLALIILLDQFSRQVYRGTPAMFASDPKSLHLSLKALDAGIQREFPTIHQIFFTLPMAHAEALPMQDRNVRYAEERAAAAAPAFVKAAQHSVKGARRHREVIVQFGRFPTRNKALGRESTPEEIEYLDYIKTNNMPL